MPEKGRVLLERLNGKIYFIKGNHDQQTVSPIVLPRFEQVRKDDCWTRVRDYARIAIEDADANHGKQDIIMAHYPIASWEKTHHGSWMLFGHCHNSFGLDLGKCIDVGVDAHNYTPVSYEQVKAIMAKRVNRSFDHHKGAAERV